VNKITENIKENNANLIDLTLLTKNEAINSDLNNKTLAMELLKQRDDIKDMVKEIASFSETAETVKEISFVLDDVLKEINQLKNNTGNIIAAHNNLDNYVNNNIVPALNGLNDDLDNLKEYINREVN
jgi:hypothetical protein